MEERMEENKKRAAEVREGGKEGRRAKGRARVEREGTSEGGARRDERAWSEKGRASVEREGTSERGASELLTR